MAALDPGANRTAQVARAGGIMVVSMLLSRVLGLARETVMTATFGIGAATDAYSIAVQIPDLIFMLIAGGGLSSAFIPAFSDLLHKGKEREAWRTFSVVATVTFLASLVLVLAAWLLAPDIVAQFRGEHGAESWAVIGPQTVAMSRILLPAQVAFLVGSVMMATLYARRQFAAPGLAPNVYNVGIIVGATLLPRFLGFGIEGMAWGGLVGALLGNLLLPALAMAKAGSHFEPSLDVRGEGVRKFFVLLLPVILGFSLPSVVNLITQKFASGFGGEGVNTVLRSANTLMQAPLGFFGQALALAVFPVLAEYVAKDRMDLYREQVSKTLRTVVYLGTMSGALMLALAPQIARLLYGWGVARGDEAALDGIADCLRIYALAIFAWCMQPVLMRGFFSLHKTLKPVVIGTVMTGVFILLCLVATRTSTDYRTLPLATDVAAVLLAVVLFFGLESDVGRLDRRGVLETWLKASVAGAAGGAVAYAGTLLFPHHGGSRLMDLGQLFLFGLAGFWTFFAVGKALKMPESAYLDKALSRFRKA